MGRKFRIDAWADPVAGAGTGIRQPESVSFGEHWQGAVPAGVGLSQDQGMGYVRRTTITVAALALAMVDATTNGSQGSQKIIDFPLGAIKVLGASFNLTTARVGTNLQANAALIGSIGSAAAGVDTSLTSTEADVIPSTSGTLSGGAGAFKGNSTATAFLDGSASAKSLYLNVVSPDAGSAGNDTLTVNGTIEIFWMHLGNGS